MSGEVSETPADYTGYANRSTRGVAIHARSHHGARDRSKRAANPFGMLFQPSSLTPPFSSSAVAIVEPQTSTAHHIES